MKACKAMLFAAASGFALIGLVPMLVGWPFARLSFWFQEKAERQK